MHDDFCISARAELMALCFQLVPKRLKVVDLTVENDPNAIVLIADGLVSAGNVNDGKPAHAQPDAAAVVLPEVVRAAVRDDSAHGGKHFVSGLLRLIVIQDSVDSAHGWISASIFLVATITLTLQSSRSLAFPRGARGPSTRQELLPTGPPELHAYNV